MDMHNKNEPTKENPYGLSGRGLKYWESYGKIFDLSHNKFYPENCSIVEDGIAPEVGEIAFSVVGWMFDNIVDRDQEKARVLKRNKPEGANMFDVKSFDRAQQGDTYSFVYLKIDESWLYERAKTFI
ncbi:hypothetical protein CL622_01795 [archaeon]|nr:hypothetical protein [archaeon]|tara:strand:+ start:811 stop:1191 length:381 start_codon:yes stop_codon:yes gene_type:complete